MKKTNLDEKLALTQSKVQITVDSELKDDLAKYAESLGITVTRKGEEKIYDYIKDKNEVVQKDWMYSYDGGGMPMIIPEFEDVKPEMVGKKACEAALAWEYFLKPMKKD